jgi:hypothetical protein
MEKRQLLSISEMQDLFYDLEDAAERGFKREQKGEKKAVRVRVLLSLDEIYFLKDLVYEQGQKN